MRDRVRGPGARGRGGGRRARALAWLLLAAVALSPAAQAAVRVEAIDVPPRTVAEKPFEVSVRLANDGPAREVTLFGALYRHEEGKAPCGPVTGGSFRAFTHVVQERVRLPADGVIVHPSPGGRWLHRYGVEDAPPAPTLEEFCVFVANVTSGPAIQYEAFGTTRLSVRATNAAPLPRFSWEPREPGATQDVVFEAAATDAEGDPVRFLWDFGHENATGRAVAEGARVTHFFYPAGEYVVTLTASDGLDESRATHTVRVLAAEEAPPRERGLPAPPLLALLGALIVVAAARGRSRR